MMRIATAPNATSTRSPVAFVCQRLTPVCSPLDGVSLNCSDAWRVESSVRPSNSAAIPFASIKCGNRCSRIANRNLDRADGTVLHDVTASALNERQRFVNLRRDDKP